LHTGRIAGGRSTLFTKSCTDGRFVVFLPDFDLYNAEFLPGTFRYIPQINHRTIDNLTWLYGFIDNGKMSGGMKWSPLNRLVM
jgi:hypothetical protein